MMEEKLLVSDEIVVDEVELTNPFDECDPFDECGCAQPSIKRQRQESVSSFELNEVVLDVPFSQHEINMPCPYISGNSSADSLSNTSTKSETFSDTSQEDECSDEFFEDVTIDEPCIHDNTDEKLYPSSSNTVVEAIALLLSWFCSSPGLSKEAFSKLLNILHNFILPRGNILPQSYGKALSLVKKMIVPIKTFHCCINDCILFRLCEGGDYSSLTSCPKCNELRFELGSNVPRKTFKYVPLLPRLKRMFQDPKMSERMQGHLKAKPPLMISDVHDSKAWRKQYATTGLFQGDARGVSLAFCTDGLNPFSKEKVSYSMWPLVLTVLNLPRNIRNLFGSMLLCGIIPGRSEPKCVDPYLDLLVEEIIQLNGFKLYDGYQNEYFELKVSIMFNVLDYPGQCKVFHCQGAGAYAGCAYCTIQGEYSDTLNKIIYPGNRRFLLKNDSLRRDKFNFPSKRPEHKHQPEMKTTKYVDEANSKYLEAVDKKERTLAAQKTGCKGPYSFRKLPSHERILSTPVDPMHLVKNIVEHCIKLISGTSDSVKVRQQEEELNRFTSSWTEGDELPPAPFVLTKSQVVLADQRAKSILVNSSMEWRPRALFNRKGAMKAHEWKEVATCGVIKFCLRGMLGVNQRSTLFRFMDVISEVCAEEINATLVDEMEEKVHRALALLERDFPISLQVIVFHLFHHLPSYIKRYGPVYGFWMYPYERFNSWIARRVKNKRYPESTVVETYRLSEWAHYMQLSKQLANGTVSGFDECTEYQGNEEPTGETYQLTNVQLDKLQHFYDTHCTILGSKERVDPTKATQVMHLTYNDSHGRLIKLCTVDEKEFSYRRCSFISASVDEVLMYGRVLAIIKHTFLSMTTPFVYVSWFDDPITDTETNLVYVFTVTSNQSLIPVSMIIKTLITALDEEEEDKLWILN